MKSSLLLSLICIFCLLAPAVGAQVSGDVDPLDLDINGGFVSATAVQSDGKIIIAGSFSGVLGVPRLKIARINPDGTLDAGFDPKVNGSSVESVAVQADGKVLLGGLFSSLQPNGAASPSTRSVSRDLTPMGRLTRVSIPRRTTVSCA